MPYRFDMGLVMNFISVLMDLPEKDQKFYRGSVGTIIS